MDDFYPNELQSIMDDNKYHSPEESETDEAMTKILIKEWLLFEILNGGLPL